MRLVYFCHSLLSCWNHGNAHFLRGIARALLSEGHSVHFFEPKNSWSLNNLVERHGLAPIRRFHEKYPELRSTRYDPKLLDLDGVLDDADLVIVHEWNDHDLVRRIGKHRARSRDYRLLFHDTHHRAITDPVSMESYDLRHYDGVLAFGSVLRDIYMSRGLAARVWTFHEAADTSVFRPDPSIEKTRDAVWIGNWGDNERTRELKQFLFDPVSDLRLKVNVYGVRYPETALQELQKAGIEFGGWIPNFEAPRTFSRFRFTVHVPRAPYVKQLPGIPTIRVFEALSCGIPLICAPWQDCEHLFTPGTDYLVAKDGSHMRKMMREVLCDRELADSLSQHGRRTILNRHTCMHRAHQLLDIYHELAGLRSREQAEIA
jgi:spore maturation protein CgeB